MDERGEREGISRYPVKKFLSHIFGMFRRGTAQCVTNFGSRKILELRKGGR